MDDISQIARLASIIKTNTDKIDEHLKLEGAQSPTLAVDANPDVILPQELRLAQSQILEACTDLQALLEGPRAYLTRITSPRINIFASLHAIYQYKITTAFPVGEEITYKELAKRCSIDEGQLVRLIRMAIANYIFTEPRKGVVAHSAISKLIAEDNLVYEWIGMVGNDMWSTGTNIVPAITKWPGSMEPTETAFALGKGMSFWDLLQQDPERAIKFAKGMQFLQSHPAFNIEHLVKSLGWDTESAPKLMVDMGGSSGSIAKALLERYPKLEIHVQDVPEALAGAEVPGNLEGRLSFSPHNFFTPQSINGADVYFLRSILHDWSDKYAVAIIKNIIPALKPGGRVIVNEVVLPEPNSISNDYAQLLRGYDLSMLQLFNAKERDAAEWEALFQDTDSRFKLERIATVPGSLLSVVEFVWLADEPTLGGTADGSTGGLQRIEER